MAVAERKALTKGQLVADVADKAGADKKMVSAVIDALHDVVERELKRGPGFVNLFGMFKVKKVVKPATKERTGIDPFTKQERVFKAKPARTVVKVNALKGLKDMVG